MFTTKKLLDLLTDAFPPRDGAHHAVCLQNGKLLLALSQGPEWRTFTIADEDLARTPEDLFTDISNILAAIEFDRNTGR